MSRVEVKFHFFKTLFNRRKFYYSRVDYNCIFVTTIFYRTEISFSRMDFNDQLYSQNIIDKYRCLRIVKMNYLSSLVHFILMVYMRKGWIEHRYFTRKINIFNNNNLWDFFFFYVRFRLLPLMIIFLFRFDSIYEIKKSTKLDLLPIEYHIIFQLQTYVCKLCYH